jgi:histidyl-tRNA synthetase
VERLVMLLPEKPAERRCDVFLIPLASQALDPALLLQRRLRMAGVRSLMESEGRSFKSRMKMADKLGARLVVILGEDEMKKGVWSVRDMAASTQEDVPEAGLLEHLKERIHG